MATKHWKSGPSFCQVPPTVMRADYDDIWIYLTSQLLHLIQFYPSFHNNLTYSKRNWNTGEFRRLFSVKLSQFWMERKYLWYHKVDQTLWWMVSSSSLQTGKEKVRILVLLTFVWLEKYLMIVHRSIINDKIFQLVEIIHLFLWCW